MKTNGIILINLHSVLIDFQFEIYKNIQQKWSQYCGYLDFPKFISHEEFFNRRTYDMCNLLMLNNYKTKANYLYGICKVQSNILHNIIETDGFYESCELLTFAKDCILKHKFIENSKIKKIVILIDEYSEKQKTAAIEFCHKIFDHHKIGVICVAPEKKWELITTKLKSFTLLIDHSISTIKNIAETTKSLENIEFLIPRYKFNKMPLELSMLIHGKKGSFSYYGESEK